MSVVRMTQKKYCLNERRKLVVVLVNNYVIFPSFVILDNCFRKRRFIL